MVTIDVYGSLVIFTSEGTSMITAISARRRAVRLAAGVVGLALTVSACGSSSTASNGATSSTTKAAEATTTAKTGDSTTTSGAVMEQIPATTLNASGATFPQAFYQEAIKAFAAEQPNVTINYAGGGSGKGQTDLQGGLVAFAGSDGLPKPEDAAKYTGGKVLYFPTVAAPITVSFNVDGVDALNLSADTLAKIFQKTITKWDDAAIKAENADAKLPSIDIVVAVRQDASGTTGNFTKYLKAASPEFKLEPGKEVKWPEGVQKGAGNAGVAKLVKDTAGAIGYVDFSDAKATGLKFASIKNKDGKYVAASLEGASAALAGAEIKDDLSYNPLNAAGPDSYAITAPTWILVYEAPKDAAQAKATKAFIKFILTKGQEMASSVDFAPLPKALVEKALAQLDAFAK